MLNEARFVDLGIKVTLADDLRKPAYSCVSKHTLQNIL